MGVLVVFVYPILFHSCTDSSNVLCLSLLELEEQDKFPSFTIFCFDRFPNTPH